MCIRDRLNGGGSEAGGSDGDSFAAIEQYHAAATNPSGATTDSGKSIGGEPAPSNPDPKDPVGQQQALGEAPPSGGSGKPTNQTVDPAPTGPDGKPSPPAVPVPGCPTCKWVWAPNGQNSRGGTWVPDNYPPTPGANPKASWDTGSRGGPGPVSYTHLWALSGAPAYYGAPSTSANGSPVLFMPDGARYTCLLYTSRCV